MVKLKQETVRLFNKKNRHGAFGYYFLSVAAEEIRKQDKYKDDEAIQNLQLTYRWTKKKKGQKTSRPKSLTFSERSNLFILLVIHLH